jgi:hypothetical protein
MTISGGGHRDPAGLRNSPDVEDFFGQAAPALPPAQPLEAFFGCPAHSGSRRLSSDRSELSHEFFRSWGP